MHALSRTGGTAKAYGIWQEISESKDHSTAANNASINIVSFSRITFPLPSSLLTLG